MSTLTLNTRPRLSRLPGFEFAGFARLGAPAYPDSLQRLANSRKEWCTVFRRKRRAAASRAL